MEKCNIRLTAVIITVAITLGGWYILLREDRNAGPIVESSGALIRLHVLANSDSAEDQRIKYLVRDAVVQYLAPYLKESASTEEARQVIALHRDEIISVARTVLAKNDARYSVVLESGWFDFPLRSYGTIVLPAGKYEAVRILLGDAEGQNWWCVLFPPLCFVDGTSVSGVPILTDGRQTQVQPEAKPELKWKIAELWNNR